MQGAELIEARATMLVTPVSKVNLFYVEACGLLKTVDIACRLCIYIDGSWRWSRVEHVGQRESVWEEPARQTRRKREKLITKPEASLIRLIRLIRCEARRAERLESHQDRTGSSNRVLSRIGDVENFCL